MIKVTAAIIYSENKVLLARRGPAKHLAGYWEFPGGKIEKGEEPEICLIREIREELAVDIQVDSFFMENQHNYGSKEILLKSYFCQLANNKDFILSDHDKIEWVEISDLMLFNLAPADIPIVQALMNG